MTPLVALIMADFCCPVAGQQKSAMINATKVGVAPWW